MTITAQNVKTAALGLAICTVIGWKVISLVEWVNKGVDFFDTDSHDHDFDDEIEDEPELITFVKVK